MARQQPGASAANVGAVAAGGKRPRRRGLAWLLLGLLLLLLLVLALVALLSSGSSHKSAVASHQAASPHQAPQPAAPTAASGGTLTAASQPILPLPPGQDLRKHLGQSVEARAVTVESVTSDNGFWVGSSRGERVFVQLDGERAPQVKVGEPLSFSGSLHPGPPDLDKPRGIGPGPSATQIEHEGGFVLASGLRHG